VDVHNKKVYFVLCGLWSAGTKNIERETTNSSFSKENEKHIMKSC